MMDTSDSYRTTTWFPTKGELMEPAQDKVVAYSLFNTNPWRF